MDLTEHDLRIAAERAAIYPPGNGFTYFAGLRVSNAEEAIELMTIPHLG